jgi:hypothetical protein
MLDLLNPSRPARPRVDAPPEPPVPSPRSKILARIVEEAERAEERAIAQRQAETARRDQPRPYRFD